MTFNKEMANLCFTISKKMINFYLVPPLKLSLSQKINLKQTEATML